MSLLITDKWYHKCLQQVSMLGINIYILAWQLLDHKHTIRMYCVTAKSTELHTMSWQIYPTASSEDSFNISVELGLVTLVVNTVIISGHDPSGSSAHAIYATHCAAVLGIICSLPRVSRTYSPPHTHQNDQYTDEHWNNSDIYHTIVQLT